MIWDSRRLVVNATGQYFMWVNYDKRQYLGDDVSDGGLKVIETAHAGSQKTDVLSTLLGTVWRGDLVVFLGKHFYDIGEYAVLGMYDGLIILCEGK